MSNKRREDNIHFKSNLQTINWFNLLLSGVYSSIWQYKLITMMRGSMSSNRVCSFIVKFQKNFHLAIKQISQHRLFEKTEWLYSRIWYILLRFQNQLFNNILILRSGTIMQHNHFSCNFIDKFTMVRVRFSSSYHDDED